MISLNHDYLKIVQKLLMAFIILFAPSLPTTTKEKGCLQNCVYGGHLILHM